MAEFDTSDQYTDAASVRVMVPVKQVTITVMNNGATAMFAVAGQGLRPGAFPFNTDEKPMIPGVWKWTSDDFNGAAIVGVQFRSQTPGNPSHVIVHA